MDSKYLIRVPYLEGMDLNDDGSLKSYVGNGKPVVVFVQGLFCGYCTKAKPDFQNFCKNPNAVGVTIQIDGSPTEKEANTKIAKVNTARGVPAYIGFDKNGAFKAIHNGNRDASSLAAFAAQL